MRAAAVAEALRCGRPGCPCGRGPAEGGNWLRHCPAHDDAHPSLSLRAGDDGRILVSCFAGCSQEGVIGALRERGLWPPAPSKNGGKPKARETRFEVRGQDGGLVAVHVRVDGPNGKTFFWERPDGSKGLGGLAARDLPLYGCERLPALDDGAQIVLVEGEKAAEALLERGVVAAGSICGAGVTPSDDVLRALVRLSPVLWPDADGPGRQHMRRIAEALKRLGCDAVRVVEPPEGVPAGWDAADFEGSDAQLAALLAAARPAEAEPEVDGAALLDEVSGFVKRYVVLGDAERNAVALWVLHTWAVEAADSTPYLNVTSPEKRCGKSRLLEVLALLVANPWLTARVSPAVLVRRLARDGPTLLLDESDAAFKDSSGDYAEALRAVLNAGHRRGGCASLCVKRGAGFDLVDFPVFGCKALTGIGRQHLPETVRDRSVPIELRRRRPDERVERFRRREAEAIAGPIRDGLDRWAAAHLERLRAARPAIPDELDDRAADGWEPLFAIADEAGGDWPQRARAAASQLSAGEGREDESLGVRLLRDVRAVFDKAGAERLPSAEIVGGLMDDETAPWGDLRGRPLDVRTLAKLLRRYGIHPHLMRVDGREPVRGYRRSDFEDVFARYLPETVTTVTSVTPNTNDVTDVTVVTVNPGIQTDELREEVVIWEA